MLEKKKIVPHATIAATVAAASAVYYYDDGAVAVLFSVLCNSICIAVPQAHMCACLSPLFKTETTGETSLRPC